MGTVTTYDSQQGTISGGSSQGDNDWMPPACDPAWVLSAIATQNLDACRGALKHGVFVWSNVVERAAVAYALLREMDRAAVKPLVMWETLEALGHEVSPEFAELGAESFLLMEVTQELLDRRDVPVLRRDLAVRALGRLWAAAFVGPPGYDQFIARSAVGAVDPDLNFFGAARSSMDGVLLGRHLLRMVDLLQIAVAMRDVPDIRGGQIVESEDWSGWVASIGSGRGAHRPQPLEVHVRRHELGAHCQRIMIKLVDTATGQPIGVGTATVLDGQTGMYDEFLDITGEVGGQVEQTLRAVFGPSDVVTIYPRVRRVLDACENQLHRLVVIESLSVARDWRTRSLGKRMLRQLLVECDDAQLVLGRPAAQDLPQVLKGHSTATQAASAAASLRLARYWHEVGAEYLINGVMGMAMGAIQAEQSLGQRERQGKR